MVLSELCKKWFKQVCSFFFCKICAAFHRFVQETYLVSTGVWKYDAAICPGAQVKRWGWTNNNGWEKIYLQGRLKCCLVASPSTVRLHLSVFALLSFISLHHHFYLFASINIRVTFVLSKLLRNKTLPMNKFFSLFSFKFQILFSLF